jgi:hypothetical protein
MLLARVKLTATISSQRDGRLDKRDADVVLEERLARINSTIDAQGRRLDEITLKSARPVFGAERATASAARPRCRLVLR